GYSVISGFILSGSRHRGIRILCPTAIRYFFSLGLFASTEWFVTMKPLMLNTGQLLRHDALNGSVKTKHCSRKRSLSGKPPNPALQTDERRASVSAKCKLMLAPARG